ncbi:MAG: hypothetical protein U0271_42250 [Polyangiaceae bacterium]
MAQGGEPEDGEFHEPVEWLFGPQLLASLKDIVLDTFFHDRLDAADWMSVGRVAFTESDLDEDGALWFDYLADAGDGTMPMYGVAYMALSEFALGGDKTIQFAKTERISGARLRRGSFLLVGGDTAYHVANTESIAERFRAPFERATRELATERKAPLPERPILAIPGNHDYYDQLHGFNRQFRRPVQGGERPVWSAKRGAFVEPYLDLTAFKRVQESSYFAVELPFGWELWGLDTEGWELDTRQAAYFTSRAAQRLIVVTSSPGFVFGAPVPPARPVFEGVGLEFEYPPSLGDAPETQHRPARRALECRLDLSGDIHHYARYWGGGPCPNANNTVSTVARDGTVYASVVSGLGGAFHQPTSTMFGGELPIASFPDPTTSLRRTAQQALTPIAIMNGGYVQWVGAVTAGLVQALSFAPKNRPIAAAVTWPLRRLAGAESAAPAIAIIEYARALAPLAALVASPILLKLVRAPRWAVLGGTLIALVAAVFCVSDIPVGALLSVNAWVVLLLLSPIAFTIFGAKAGAAGMPKPSAPFLFGALGLGHGLAQITLPTLAAWVPAAPLNAWIVTFFALGAALATTAALRRYAERATFAGRHRAGAVILLTSTLFALVVAASSAVLAGTPRVPPIWLDALVRTSAAAVAGFVLSPTLLGLYLAVSLFFDAHNNEVGGAARSAEFKQFIRFRLTKDELRGFVIGFRRPKRRAADLKLELVDEFVVRPAATPESAPRPSDPPECGRRADTPR